MFLDGVFNVVFGFSFVFLGVFWLLARRLMPLSAEKF
jgi:hypothetical protein